MPRRPDSGRPLAKRVKTAKARSPSSTRWLARQLNDPYVAAAKREGYRSRAAFKLIELDDRLRLLKPGARVVDLGAAPGGWTQVAVARVKPLETRGAVVALDSLPMDPMAGAIILTADFLAPDAPGLLRGRLGGPVDVVLSDMAPSTTGHRETDHLRIMNLVEAALAFAAEVLRPGGAFIAKMLQGGGERALIAEARRHFATVRQVKPAASRAESVEFFIVATGFRKAAEVVEKR
ncbi:MAG: RlmE family RNA methyltransferase [Proteobacteria bacterium]|nr:RlmE family RNA methyltransferase [Pseudomonadota bacterium]